MKFAILLLATVASTASTNTNELIITSKFYSDNFTLYASDHDIIDIVVPLNRLNYPDATLNVKDGNAPLIFFVVADINNGNKDCKGLYVFKNNLATKLLDNGQCVTYAKEKDVYFGAKDGIYKYNHEDKTASKYNSVKDSVIKMAFDSKHLRVYYITEDYVVYKYNENEIASSKVDAVQDARDIAFDFTGNMFYYDDKKQLYTYNGERVLKIEGLPANPTEIDLVRSPVVFNQVMAVIDGRLYDINANGTSVKTLITFQAKPTAFAPDNYVFQYYAYNKKIYEYNMNTWNELSQFLEDKDQINALKSKLLPEAEPKSYVRLG